MEGLITRHISDYLQEHALLTDHRFGFRLGRSTADQLLLVYETLSGIVDNGGTVDVIYFDYSKAGGSNNSWQQSTKMGIKNLLPHKVYMLNPRYSGEHL